MPHFDATTAECLVLTYKEGLLSAVAHDLEIRVSRFDLDVDPETLAVQARFDATSLQVVGAVHDGAVQPATLGESDRQKIQHSIATDVLHTAVYPAILFASTSVTPEGDGFRITGTLTLHGRSQPLSLVARPRGDRLVAEARLHQPDFGIKPYSALLGTLKVKADVTIRCAVPREGLPGR